jgi:hypothetical protein
LQLHGDAHVAFDAELALHERSGRVELAASHVDEVFELHFDGRVGRRIFSGNFAGRAVEEDLAGVAEVNFTFLPGTSLPSVKRFRDFLVRHGFFLGRWPSRATLHTGSRRRNGGSVKLGR